MAVFEFSAYLEKTDETGLRFRGVASSTSLDRQQDRITERALASMAKQVPVVLTEASSHLEAQIRPSAEIGEIDGFFVQDNKLCVDGYLYEDHPWSAFLYKRMVGGRYKLSIGGRVPDDSVKVVYRAETGVRGRDIDDVILNHVMLCRADAAANQDTTIVGADSDDWALAIAKAAVGLEEIEVHKGWGNLSMSQVIEGIKNAVAESVADGDSSKVWVVELFEDYAILQDDDGYQYKVSYRVRNNDVEVDPPEPVEQEWVAALSPGLDVDKAKWSVAYINDLPDSAFLYIEPGGKKDEEGKTVPRSLRHLPVKDKEGNYDAAHLRNAIARAPMIKLKDGSRISEAKARALQNKARDILERINKSTPAPVADQSSEEDMADEVVVDRLVSILEGALSRVGVEKATSAEEPAGEESSTDGTKALENAVKALVDGFDHKLSEMYAKFDEAIAELKVAKAEPVTEEKDSEEIEEEETVEASDAPSDLEKAVGVIAAAVRELQSTVATLAEKQATSEVQIAEIAKAAPQSLQAPPDHNQHSEENEEPRPIQAMLKGAWANVGY